MPEEQQLADWAQQVQLPPDAVHFFKLGRHSAAKAFVAPKTTTTASPIAHRPEHIFRIVALLTYCRSKAQNVVRCPVTFSNGMTFLYVAYLPILLVTFAQPKPLRINAPAFVQILRVMHR